MIATISSLMAIPDAIYLPYERADAHTTGPRMVRTRPHGYRIDRSRLIKTPRPREVTA
jgi:hypothetical protein